MTNLTTWIASLLSTLAVSLLSLVGLVTLSFSEARSRRIAAMLVSLAVGTLLGDAFIHLVPEALASSDGSAIVPSLLVLAGMLSFFLVDKLLRRRWGLRSTRDDNSRAPAQLVTLNVIGDALHNFIDGVLIAGGYLVSPALGLSTTIAVVCHEIPQELADFGVLVYSGLGVRKSVAVNLMSASTAMLGTVLTLVVGAAAGPALTRVLIPMTAGGFVYIASANLMPELQRDRGLGSLIVQVSLIALGIAGMALLTFVE